jgi:hypothetical protein
VPGPFGLVDLDGPAVLLKGADDPILDPPSGTTARRRIEDQVGAAHRAR